jgi:hypothetical protein
MSQTYFDSQIWKNKNFPNQLSEKEDILLVLREDIVILVFQVISFVIFFLLASLAKAVLSRFFDGLGPTKYILDIVYHTFNILLIAGFLMRFHDYYLSVQIVTTQRIIDIAQKGLFGREVNELQFDKIEDVTHKQNGLIATIFNFGDVVVQTAASASSKTSGFVFKNIPNPAKAHKIIMDVCHDENPTIQTVYVANQYPPSQYANPNLNPNPNQNPNQFNPNVTIANPLPPAYRENVLNTSDNLNDKNQS